MNATATSARCEESFTGRRLLIEQHATDDTGVAVVVDKCWTLCPPCAETVMSQVGEVSPWRSDSRTVVLPDWVDEPTTKVHALSR